MTHTPVKSAVRALEVLLYFSQQRTPRGLKEISESLQYPTSSCAVLLKSLVQTGFLHYDRASRVYFPTMRVASLGDWIGQKLFGQGEVFDLMREIHAATGETIALAVQSDIYVQYVRVIQSVKPLRYYTEEGTTRPLTTAPLGWLFLSTHADADAERLARRANLAIEKQAERPPIDLIMRRVAESRRDGYNYIENIPVMGGGALCTLLPGSIQGNPIGIGIGAAIDYIRPDKERLLTLLRKSIARHFGSSQ